MNRRRPGSSPCLLALVLVVTVGAPPTSQPQGLARQALAAYLRASDDEFARLDRGEPISRNLQGADSREVAVAGAIRLRCSAQTFRERMLDIVRFKKSAYVLEIGRFSPEPQESDVASLKVEPIDVDALKSCRLGSCKLRLPAAAMAEASGALRDAGADGATLMRRVLVAQARAYLKGGSQGLEDYADRVPPLNRAAAFALIVRPSPFAAEHQPELYDWLRRYPATPPPGVTDYLYWSRESFGLKPVISVTHSAVMDRVQAQFFVSKQVYASRYFDASLGSAVLVTPPDQPYAYLIYLNRSRVDVFRGLLGGIARSIALRKMKDGILDTMREAKKRLESPA
jgi:hypothetical protein